MIAGRIRVPKTRIRVMLGAVPAPRPRLIPVVLALAFVLGLSASTAQAYVIHGSRWRGRTITYHSTTYKTASGFHVSTR